MQSDSDGLDPRFTETHFADHQSASLWGNRSGLSPGQLSSRWQPERRRQLALTTYEKWSLALNATGHLVVIVSIVYAALQWRTARRSNEQDIVRDTRNFLLRMEERIDRYRDEIIERGLDPSGVGTKSAGSETVRKLLNTLDSMSHYYDSAFLHRGMMERFLEAECGLAWGMWSAFVDSTRREGGDPDTWIRVERLANKHFRRSVAREMRAQTQRTPKRVRNH